MVLRFFDGSGGHGYAAGISYLSILLERFKKKLLIITFYR